MLRELCPIGARWLLDRPVKPGDDRETPSNLQSHRQNSFNSGFAIVENMGRRFVGAPTQISIPS
jgi:hypothetical protein